MCSSSSKKQLLYYMHNMLLNATLSSSKQILHAWNKEAQSMTIYHRLVIINVITTIILVFLKIRSARAFIKFKIHIQFYS